MQKFTAEVEIPPQISEQMPDVFKYWLENKRVGLHPDSKEDLLNSTLTMALVSPEDELAQIIEELEQITNIFLLNTLVSDPVEASQEDLDNLDIHIAQQEEAPKTWDEKEFRLLDIKYQLLLQNPDVLSQWVSQIRLPPVRNVTIGEVPASFVFIPPSSTTEETKYQEHPIHISANLALTTFPTHIEGDSLSILCYPTQEDFQLKRAVECFPVAMTREQGDQVRENINKLLNDEQLPNSGTSTLEVPVRFGGRSATTASLEELDFQFEKTGRRNERLFSVPLDQVDDFFTGLRQRKHSIVSVNRMLLEIPHPGNAVLKEAAKVVTLKVKNYRKHAKIAQLVVDQGCSVQQFRPEELILGVADDPDAEEKIDQILAENVEIGSIEITDVQGEE